MQKNSLHMRDEEFMSSSLSIDLSCFPFYDVHMTVFSLKRGMFLKKLKY